MTNKISFLRFEEGDYGESDSVIFIGDNGYSPDDYPIELLIEKINCAFEEELAKVRKAECERCAKIAEDHALLLNSPGEAAACREVAEMIRGGQDGEWGAV